MPYRHFLEKPARNHTTTSFLRNTIPVCRRANRVTMGVKALNVVSNRDDDQGHRSEADPRWGRRGRSGQKNRGARPIKGRFYHSVSYGVLFIYSPPISEFWVLMWLFLFALAELSKMSAQRHVADILPLVCCGSIRCSSLSNLHAVFSLFHM